MSYFSAKCLLIVSVFSTKKSESFVAEDTVNHVGFLSPVLPH